MKENHFWEGKSPSCSQEITSSLFGGHNGKERSTIGKYGYFKRWVLVVKFRMN